MGKPEDWQSGPGFSVIRNIVSCLLISICVHLCSSVVSASAQALPPRPGQPDPKAQAAESPLKPFEWLIDGTWYTEGEYPGLGKSRGMRTYRYTLGGRFIEMQQEVLIQPPGGGAQRMAVTAILGRNPGTRRLQQWGFARDGSISTAEWDVVAPPAMRFEGRVVNSSPWRLRGILSRDAADEFVETLEVYNDGGWRPHSESRFARKGVPPPPDGIGAAGPTEDLKLLAPLVGTWGQTLDVTLTFRWALNYSFLRSEYVVRRAGDLIPKVRVISMTGFDAQQKRVAQYGFNEDGSVFSASVTAAGDALVFEGDMVGDGRRKLRVTYRCSDADTLVTTTETLVEGAWQKLGETTMKRRKPALN